MRSMVYGHNLLCRFSSYQPALGYESILCTTNKLKDHFSYLCIYRFTSSWAIMHYSIVWVAWSHTLVMDFLCHWTKSLGTGLFDLIVCNLAVHLWGLGQLVNCIRSMSGMLGINVRRSQSCKFSGCLLAPFHSIRYVSSCGRLLMIVTQCATFEPKWHEYYIR